MLKQREDSGGCISTAMDFLAKYKINDKVIVAGTLMIAGVNILSFYAITNVYAFQTGLLPKPPDFYPLFKVLNLEKDYCSYAEKGDRYGSC